MAVAGGGPAAITLALITCVCVTRSVFLCRRLGNGQSADSSKTPRVNKKTSWMAPGPVKKSLRSAVPSYIAIVAKTCIAIVA